MHDIPDEPTTNTPMTHRLSRVYIHLDCDQATEISGPNFTQLCNPFEGVGELMCASCQKLVRQDRVVWADTGENIVAYRKRLLNDSPPMIRSWVRWIGPTVFMISGGFLGWYIAPLFTKDEQVIGAIAGAFGLWMLGVGIINPIVCTRLTQVDYRQID